MGFLLNIFLGFTIMRYIFIFSVYISHQYPLRCRFHPLSHFILPPSLLKPPIS
jgi:putative component of membrane protein insertase Oxa1/YidC/SpoIIIJ protein YidD